MKLLVITQAVDRQDPVLGFFHRWVEELAKKYETVEVICLKEGEHELPPNVRVHSLGKERGRSRLKYLFNFYRCIFSLRYDAVFVHMNEEYLLLGGLWWLLCGKKVVLWRNHKMGSWRTRLAVRLSAVVCHTSPEAFVARYAKARQMPVGIDTGLFSPQGTPQERVLFLGRFDPVKKVEVFIAAMKILKVPGDIYGSPTPGNEAYAREMTLRAQEVPGLAVYPSVAHEQTPALYASHAVYVNLTPSGSFDKTIGEAMASGCVVVCANSAVRGAVSEELLVKDGSPQDVVRAIDAALRLSPQEHAAQAQKAREYVSRNHSLSLLIDKLAAML